MSNCFYADATFPNSYTDITNHLLKILTPILEQRRDIVFLCIGTDRSTGDSLGPLVGYKLKFLSQPKIHIYGTLEYPVHAKNVTSIVDKINNAYNNPYIIVIDACLGNIHTIGKVYIDDKPTYPGLALNKNLPPVGDLSITGVVNLSGNFEFMVLQNTRLHTVMLLADCISNGIYHFILKSISNYKLYNNSIDFIKNSKEQSSFATPINTSQNH